MNTSHKKGSKSQTISLKDIDILIMDADFSIAPHITAALANKIAKHYCIRLYDRNVSVQKEKQFLTTAQAVSDIFSYVFSHAPHPSVSLKDYLIVLRLACSGICLHALRLIYSIFGIANSTALINVFCWALKGIDLRPFLFTKMEIENSLYPGVKDLLMKFKGKKIMISQSFSCNSKMVELYKEVLPLNTIHSNELILDKNGRIEKTKASINSSRAKQEIASIYKGRICVLVNDATDRGLCELTQTKLVIANNPNWIIKKYATVAIRNDYRSLL